MENFKVILVGNTRGNWWGSEFAEKGYELDATEVDYNKSTVPVGSLDGYYSVKPLHQTDPILVRKDLCKKVSDTSNRYKIYTAVPFSMSGGIYVVYDTQEKLYFTKTWTGEQILLFCSKFDSVFIGLKQTEKYTPLYRYKHVNIENVEFDLPF